MARLSQKQVENMFYGMCRSVNIPLYKDRNYDNSKYRTGALNMGGAYGRMRVEFIYPKSSSNSDFSGYLTAREMYNWLDEDKLKGMYTRKQKQARESLKRDEERAKARR